MRLDQGGQLRTYVRCCDADIELVPMAIRSVRLAFASEGNSETKDHAFCPIASYDLKE
jgi:hypothetical protein